MSDTKPIHHGNLRQALIDAGLDILREDGAKGLTLRRIAARAGVSHAAPAHHFKGLPGLMTAMATKAHLIFGDGLRAASTKPGDTPRARMRGLCQAYLDFSVRYGGLFHLLFIEVEVDRMDPDFQIASAKSYEALSDACAPFVRDKAAAVELEFAVWTLAHGYAQLGLGNPNSPKRFLGYPDLDRLIDMVLPNCLPNLDLASKP